MESPKDAADNGSSKGMGLPISDEVVCVEVSSPKAERAAATGSAPDDKDTWWSCAFFHRPEGCSSGRNCEYCHLCAEGQGRIRKKRKARELRTQIRREARAKSRATEHQRRQLHAENTLGEESSSSSGGSFSSCPAVPDGAQGSLSFASMTPTDEEGLTRNRRSGGCTHGSITGDDDGVKLLTRQQMRCDNKRKRKKQDQAKAGVAAADPGQPLPSPSPIGLSYGTQDSLPPRHTCIESRDMGASNADHTRGEAEGEMTVELHKKKKKKKKKNPLEKTEVEERNKSGAAVPDRHPTAGSKATEALYEVT
ncbi:unnamed protein product, partial [Amoebophrya sp. A25]|eukprot:GSA25T00002296001.1